MPGAKFLIQKIMSIIKWLLFSAIKLWSGLLDKNGLLEHIVLRTPKESDGVAPQLFKMTPSLKINIVFSIICH